MLQLLSEASQNARIVYMVSTNGTKIRSIVKIHQFAENLLCQKIHTHTHTHTQPTLWLLHSYINFIVTLHTVDYNRKMIIVSKQTYAIRSRDLFDLALNRRISSLQTGQLGKQLLAKPRDISRLKTFQTSNGVHPAPCSVGPLLRG
jgi:hypothetical protein